MCCDSREFLPYTRALGYCYWDRYRSRNFCVDAKGLAEKNVIGLEQ